jgi:diguanylate cyclase (GGDEF)-like protein
MSQPSILVAEPSAQPSRNFLRALARGAEVQVVSSVEAVVQVVRGWSPDVLIAAVSNSFDGEALTPHVRKHAPEIAVILSYPVTEVERAPERARTAGADAFLVGPPKKHHVLAIVQAVARLNVLAAQLHGLSAKFEALKASVAKQPLRAKASPVGVNAPDEAFFKKYMLLEVKRSKRYQYPVALMLVALDKLSEHLGESAPEFQRAAIRSEAIEALSVLLRDIDVAMPFGEDKYLIFLPHTPLKGTTIVAGRVVERLAKLDSFPQGTVSVGVASFDPAAKSKELVSFGGLVREAGEALKKAQEAGGNRFVAPELPAPPKKNRISLG